LRAVLSTAPAGGNKSLSGRKRKSTKFPSPLTSQYFCLTAGSHQKTFGFARLPKPA
jgi:hypothetical protein